MSFDQFEKMATEIVAKLEHGDENHKQWLRSEAIPLIANALRVVHEGKTEIEPINKLLRDSP